MTANPHRGEVEIALGGKTRVLRPTFGAMIEIEQRTGQSVMALARKLAGCDLAYGECAAIIAAGLRAAGEPAEPEAVGRMVFDQGLGSVLGAVADFLQGALGAGEPAPGEAKAASAPATAG